MSSQRRIDSSRANGHRSHGPATPAGKLRSSQNALKHGLLSDTIVLPGESAECFDTLCTEHLQRFAPADGVERGMIEEMAASYWRLRRVWAIENEFLTAALDSQPAGAGTSDLGRIAASFRQLAASPELALLHRYEARLHRMYQRAFYNVLLLQNFDPPAEDIPESLPVSPTGLAVPPDLPDDGAPGRSSPKTESSPANSASPAEPVHPQPSTPAPAPAANVKLPNEPNPISGHSPSRSSPRFNPRLRSLPMRNHNRGPSRTSPFPRDPVATTRRTAGT